MKTILRLPIRRRRPGPVHEDHSSRSCERNADTTCGDCTSKYPELPGLKVLDKAITIALCRVTRKSAHRNIFGLEACLEHTNDLLRPSKDHHRFLRVVLDDLHHRVQLR